MKSEYQKQHGVAQYLIIAETIRGWIAAGKYKSGDPIDTVDELTSQFGVAKRTIQDALKELSRRGVIATAQGKRSIVKFAPQMRAVHSNMHLNESFVLDKSEGLIREVLSISTETPDKILQNSFPFELTNSVVEFRSTLAVKKRITAYILSYIPSHLADPISHLRGKEMEDAFQRIIDAADHRQSRISAATADLEAAQNLGIPIGSPILRYRRISWSNDKDLNIYVDAVFRSDDCEYVLGENS